MKFLNKIITGLDSIISTVTTSILLVLMAFGLYALYDIYDVYDDAKLADDIVTLKPHEQETTFDLTKLKEVNKDIIGWIIINDTNIDYPILKGKDNSEYLNRNYKKEYAAAGSIFLDYRNGNLNEDYSVIYGHNMNANLMFGSIKNYKDQTYFNNHLKGILHTEKESYKLDIIAYAIVSAYDNTVYDIETNKDDHNNDILNYFKDNSKYIKMLDLKNDDKLIVLSTCDASGINERSVLLVKASKQTIDNKKEDTTKNKLIETKEKTNNPQKIINRIDKRTELLIIMFLIVLIIFLIFLIMKIIKRKNKQKIIFEKKEETKE